MSDVTPIRDPQAKSEYDDSAEFTEEWYTMLELINSERFKDWMELTDVNCGTNVAPHVQKLIEGANGIESEFERIS